MAAPNRREQRIDGPCLTAPAVLVAEADPQCRATLTRCLATAGYRVLEAAGIDEAMGSLTAQTAVAFLDLPDASALAAIRLIRERSPDTQIIVLARTGLTREALQAVKDGAFDFLTRPIDLEELLVRTRQAVRIGKLTRENRQLRESACSTTAGAELVGLSAMMLSLRKRMETLAPTDATILLTGPQGSGKTTLAHWVHRHGSRSAQPLITVHCDALPGELLEAEIFGQVRTTRDGVACDRPGRIELAHGGTLLLEEVAAVPLELQGRLAGFLRDRLLPSVSGAGVRRIDVRVLATSRHDLPRLCRQGAFREDLYEELGPVCVSVPPLHAHVDDIPVLAAEILQRFCRRRGRSVPILAGDAMAALLEHPWPANLRELELVLTRAADMAPECIHAADLFLSRRAAADVQGDGTFGLAGLPLSEIERRAILETLAACGGNKAKTARQLGVSEKTIYNKMKQYHIDRGE